MENTSKFLHSYIKEGEHQQQDFKFRIDDAKKIARTIAAFANTDGGRLLIGVKDNGKVVGVNPEEEFHMIQGAASLYCKPEVEVHPEIIQDKHKFILVVQVKKAEKRPVLALDEHDKWKIYVRREDQTLLGNKILAKLWKNQEKVERKSQSYTENEELLLSILKEHEKVTLSKLYRLTKLNKSYVDKVLVLFISWGIIEMHITPEGTFYGLA